MTANGYSNPDSQFNANDSAHSFASTRLYDPSGATVTVSFALPVSAGVIDLATANGIRESIGNLLHAGFSVSAPGLEPGQQVEEIGAVSRREKKDGTAVIDLFSASEALTYKLISLYLDTDEQLASFEKATGLKVASIPLNDADAPVKRDGKNAARLVVPVKIPVRVILVPNPKYDPNETDIEKKKPSRLFVAWEGESTQPAAMPANAPKQPVPATSAPNAGTPSQSAQTGATSTSDGLVDWDIVWASAHEEGLVNAKPHLKNLISVMRRAEPPELTPEMNTAQVLDAIRQHEAQKQAVAS